MEALFDPCRRVRRVGFAVAAVGARVLVPGGTADGDLIGEWCGGGDPRQGHAAWAGLVNLLGERVRVAIDRPLGSAHPERPDPRYPSNHGRPAGTSSSDCEPVDAYVLRIDDVVQEAVGIVVGVVRRADDVEDKLVVAADGRCYAADEIAALVAFQERYFDSRIEVVAHEGERPTRSDDEMPMAGR